MDLKVSAHIELELLLQPISAERPAGDLLRYDGTYDRIQEARREDDQRLSQGIYQTSPKRADWETDEAICLEALEKRTKDLQIAGWLLEAWLHLRGFRGVETGLRLLTGLCENFWDQMHPELEGDSFEARVAPLEWINRKLCFSLKQIPLTLSPERDGRSYTFADWESACHFENLARRDPSALQEALENIDPTIASFQNAIAFTDASFHGGVVKDLICAVDACAALQNVLDEKCGSDGPSLYQFHEVLNSIKQLMTQCLHARQDEPMQIAEEISEPVIEAEDETEVWSSGPIRHRADAYRRLAEAADYLMKTEPHSPTGYLVKRAVEWGHMSLFDVLKQIVRNDSEMEEIDRLLRLSSNGNEIRE
ncbi:MAG TPA: type VI secretion system protein TssA [Pyrinomonadaceae bacterium]|nr:type VI secretion system protein TssA [Pyrinomonadaceae bacterium]